MGLRLDAQLEEPSQSSLLIHAGHLLASAPQQPDSCPSAPTSSWDLLHILGGCEEMPGPWPFPCATSTVPTTSTHEQALPACLVLSVWTTVNMGDISAETLSMAREEARGP